MSGEVIVGVIAAVLGLAGLALSVINFYENRKLAEWSDGIQERLLNVEQARRDDEVRLRRRAQAEHVSCWVEPIDESDGPQVDVCFVRNGSPLPIYEVTVYWADRPGGELRSWGWYESLPPGGVVSEPWKNPNGPWGKHPRPLPQLAFSDSAEVRWHRDAAGKLHEVDPSAPNTPTTP